MTIERGRSGAGWASIQRTTAWVRNIVPRRLTPITRSKFSGSSSSGSPRTTAPDAGIVDQAVDAAEPVDDRGQRGGMAARSARSERKNAAPAPSSARAAIASSASVGDVGDRQVEARAGQGLGDRTADAAAPTILPACTVSARREVAHA